MNQDINSAWAAVVPMLRKLKFYDIKSIVGLAGFDIKILNGLGNSVDSWGNEYKNENELVDQIERYFLDFPDNEKANFLNTVIERILSGDYELGRHHYVEDLEESLQYYLKRLGWQLIDNKVLPSEVLDSSDLDELDPAAREDLVKAAIKFRDGDLSGSLSSACAAVDSVTERLYREKNLGDVKKSSFQERCTKSLEAVGVFKAIDQQLIEIEWKNSDISLFKSNLKQSLNQAAYVMQTLRSDMSDVHGTKPVIKPLVFDSIKWSQIIVRLLSEKYDD